MMMAVRSMRQVAREELARDDPEDDNDEPAPRPRERNARIIFDPDQPIRGRSEREDDEEERPAPKKKTAAKRIELGEVEIDGKKYKVDKEAIAKIQEAMGGAKGSRGIVDEIKRVLAETTQQPKKKTKAQDDDEEEDDSLSSADVDLFADPKKFLTNFAKNIRKQVLDEVKGLYTKEQGQQNFWKDFYKNNEDLAEDDTIVQAVLAKNLKELAPMKTNEAAERLAELSRAEILRIAKKFKARNRDNTRVEGSGSNRRQEREVEEEEDQEERDQPQTLSAVLKLRRQRRLNSSNHASQEE